MLTKLSRFVSSLSTLAIVLVGLSVYSFIGAQTWTAPISAPTANNAPAPINVGGVAQTKTGNLTVNGNITSPSTLGANQLNVIGGIRFANSGPLFTWSDTDAADRDFHQHVNANVMYFLTDRNNNGTWDAPDWATAHPMSMFAGTAANLDYVNFSNDVNAGRNVNAANDVVATNQVRGLSNQIVSTGPTALYNDTDHKNWWTHVNSDRFYFLADRNDNGDWAGEGPWPLEMYAGPNSTSDFALFSNDVHAGRDFIAAQDVNAARNVNAANQLWSPTVSTGNLYTANVWANNLLNTNYVTAWAQVRSNSYCDVWGNNCIAPWDIAKKGATTFETYCEWTPPMGQWGGGTERVCNARGAGVMRGFRIEDNQHDIAQVQVMCCYNS